MKQKLNSGDEQDAIEHRRRYKFLRRAGVTSEIKRDLRRRLRREGKPRVPAEVCRPYWCPTAESYECCGLHGGFDACCDAPELHWPLTESQLNLFRLLGEPMPGGRR